MLVFDYLILNRDRHGANMEGTDQSIPKNCAACPLFDHGVSLFSRTPDDAALAKEDVMADKPVQCFVGTRSAWENLHLIPKDVTPSESAEGNRSCTDLLDGLDEAFSPYWLERIWEMIWRRWKTYENLRNQR